MSEAQTKTEQTSGQVEGSLDERPVKLSGVTYKRKISTDGNELNIYVTICHHNGVPFEMFLNCSNAQFMELTSVVMILASRLLRAGIDPATIADDLESIHSPFTGHFSTFSAGYCPSLAASIGQIIRQHVSAD